MLADIGDMQSVGEDLSTFSGHLLVCKAVLAAAARTTGHSLVLMDEMGSGTDPAQGVAIAQALLEVTARGTTQQPPPSRLLRAPLPNSVTRWN